MVTSFLKAAIVQFCIRNRAGPKLARLERFWATYPFERLVDLVVMIAAEFKQMSRVVRIGSSLSVME